MRYFIDGAGNYYEGDRAHSLDVSVPQRPSADYDWNGSAWVLNAQRASAAQRRADDATEAAAAKLDVQLASLIDMTPAQINTAIDNAFPDPAQRVILKRMAKVLVITARMALR
jgi:hypothetical protein